MLLCLKLGVILRLYVTTPPSPLYPSLTFYIASPQSHEHLLLLTPSHLSSHLNSIPQLPQCIGTGIPSHPITLFHRRHLSRLDFIQDEINDHHNDLLRQSPTRNDHSRSRCTPKSPLYFPYSRYRPYRQVITAINEASIDIWSSARPKRAVARGHGNVTAPSFSVSTFRPVFYDGG